MVSWLELRTSIEKNSRNSYNIPVLKIRNECIKPIDRYPILSVDVPVEVTAKPVPPVAAKPVPPVAAKPAPAVAAKPAPAVATKPAPAVAAKPIVPKSTLPQPLSYQVDPIVLGIADGLYENAGSQMKRQMQCEEAQRVEGLIASLYTSQGGRSRGWTKTGLEACIKPRCSSGGDLHALDKAKSTFLWPLVRTDKTASAFLDFLCVAKSIRVAVWFDEEKTVMVYPAADKSGGEPVTNYPLFNVSYNGFMLRSNKIHNGADLVTVCEENGYSYLPPYSVSHSLSNLTVGELASVATKLGMSEISGTKAERVGKISQYKLRQRLIPGSV